MKRLLRQVIAAAVLVALLAACSNPSAGDRLTVRLDSSNNLGYEISSSGEITITERSFVFRNAPGEPQAIITGIGVAYFNSSGALLEEWIAEPNSLSIFVPAGFSCTAPDPVTGCTMLSLGAVPAPGQASDPAEATGQFLSGDIAAMHAVDLGPSTWWAEFTFYGENVRGPIELNKTFFIVAPN